MYRARPQPQNIRLLGPGDSRVPMAVNAFYNGWLHPHKQPPMIVAVYEILYSEQQFAPYPSYRDRVGNEQMLFHGTRRACLLGENPNCLVCCNEQACQICSIIRSSFDVSRSGSRFSFGRFGRGVYTSRVSSKADDYCCNAVEQFPVRAMLLNAVATGKQYRVLNNQQQLTGPPKGYNSVVGVPGKDLNYEETVVYTNDAIRPVFLITYRERPMYNGSDFTPKQAFAGGMALAAVSLLL